MKVDKITEIEVYTGYSTPHTFLNHLRKLSSTSAKVVSTERKGGLDDMNKKIGKWKIIFFKFPSM